MIGRDEDGPSEVPPKESDWTKNESSLYGLLTPIQDEMDDKYGDYCYLYHKYWCELLSILESKYNRNSDDAKI